MAGPSVRTSSETLHGRIAEVVVENLINKTTRRFTVLVAEDGRRLLLNGLDAQHLEAGAAVSVEGRVQGRTLYAKSLVSRVRPAQRLPAITSTREYRGRFRLAYADNFDGQASELVFLLYAADGSHIKVKLATQLGVLTDRMEVAIIGHPDTDGELIAERIVIESIAPDERKATIAPAAVTSNVLVIPIKFKNASDVYPADPQTIASIDTVVFGTGSSVARYYQEASYGEQLLAGVVANDAGTWLKSTVAAPTPTACNSSLIQTQGDAAATAAGYNLSNYPYRIYVFASTGFSCPWAGLGGVGYGRAWVKQGNVNLLVVGHELGHNFGLYHSASLDCGANVIGGTCNGSEYGDPFNMMGNSRGMHFSALQKRDLNYISAASVATHTTGTTTYSLTPLETASGNLYAVKVPVAANRQYWIEYRQPIGFDSGLASFPNNGAQFRLASPLRRYLSRLQ